MTENVSNAELSFAEEEIEKCYKPPLQYQREIPQSVKTEVSKHARDFGTASAVKKYTMKYPKYTFKRTTVNSWKNKFKNNENVVVKTVGRPNILDDRLLKKVKDIAIGTRRTAGVINRRQLISIGILNYMLKNRPSCRFVLDWKRVYVITSKSSESINSTCKRGTYL